MFDLERAWELSDRVALRPEPFGALVYDFGTRRLSFLKTRQLLALVESLAGSPSARAACAEAGVADAELGSYARALATLAEAGTIVERAC